MVCSCLENSLDRETTLHLEWYTGSLGHLHRVMQCPLYEWGNNRTPMGRGTPDVVNRSGSLRGGMCDLLQTLSVDGLAAQEGFCRDGPDHGRCHRTEGNLDLLAHTGLFR
jgi:hypothetical protein